MKGKKLLITGAGSVGIAFFNLLEDDFDITIIDNNEWALAELRDRNVKVILDDYANITGQYDYVIHTGNYKHVGLCEDNIIPTVRNNIIATGEFYSKLKPSTKLLFASTDKSVEPTSVYGATKMILERLTWQYGWQIFRSGNFLGSNGSAMPIWERQILNNQPITITDVHMRRFVTEIEPAIKEIWDRFLKGERLIVPQLREVGVLDLLDEVLVKHNKNLSTYEPGIDVIGMRPGEKLTEKLYWPEECRR